MRIVPTTIDRQVGEEEGRVRCRCGERQERKARLQPTTSSVGYDVLVDAVGACRLGGLTTVPRCGRSS